MLLQPNHNKFGLYKEKAGLKLLPPQEGLYINIDMEKIVGTTIYDRTPYANNGTMNNISVVNGIKDLNKATKATTVNSANRISFSQSSISGISVDNFTMEFWEKHTNFSTTATTPVLHLFTSGYGVVRFQFGYGADATEIERKRLRVVINGTNYRSSFYSEYNTWYHYCVVKTGETMTIFRNGEIDFVITGFSTMIFSDCIINNLFGNNINACFEGIVGVFRVWNRSLSTKEIQYLHNNGYGIK